MTLMCILTPASRNKFIPIPHPVADQLIQENATFRRDLEMIMGMKILNGTFQAIVDLVEALAGEA